MPGWAASTEALHRGQHRAGNLVQISNAAVSASKALLLFSDNNQNNASFRARISLAATVRKLLWPYLQREGETAQG